MRDWSLAEAPFQLATIINKMYGILIISLGKKFCEPKTSTANTGGQKVHKLIFALYDNEILEVIKETYGKL